MTVPTGALLSFSLGPVQPFIASARTVRDLWTGSYLLSWLTFAAMRPVLDRLGEDAFVIPSLESNPLYQRWYGRKDSRVTDELLTPCLPNRFLVQVGNPVQAVQLGAECEASCRAAWEKIETAVRKELERDVDGLDPLQLWAKQVRDIFEIRTVVLPLAEATPERCRELFPEQPAGWKLQFDLLGGLLDATRSVKHVPVYEVTADRVPQKCSLLGTYEQLGPADLDKSREFWADFARESHRRGSKTSPRERLCALSLIKRFAWAHYFSKAEFNCETRRLRYADTATAAAEGWLTEVGFDRELVRDTNWNGQWLHWSRRDQDPDEECPEAVWNAIQQAKQRAKEKPPAYYAILMLDGDRMGKIMRNAGSAEQSRKFSQALTRFAVDRVREIVDRHDGELIFAGGDDVLAVLPTRTSLACARELERVYRETWAPLAPTPTPSMSGGIVVAHYKEDLRFAMNEARAAEKEAKSAGRDALTLRVLRRSGEHTSVVLGWDQTHELDALVDQFAAGFSDRWAYKLRTLLPTLAVDDPTALDRFRSELGRLLHRVEADGGDLDAVREQTLGLLASYRGWTQDSERAQQATWPLPRVLTGFVTLCQSASFLARGREE
jgi:CRISPR-associated protein Cmr2